MSDSNKSPKREYERKEIPAEVLLNRQINFYIMREMWQIIVKNGKKFCDSTIAQEFGMSRTRYTHAIDTGKIRISIKEAEELHQKTGILSNIFTGVERFTLSTTISNDDWTSFLLDRTNPSNKQIKEKINSALHEEKRDYSGNASFFKLCHYLKYLKPFNGSIENNTIQVQTAQLQKISVGEIQACQQHTLSKYIEVLTRQLNYAHAVNVLRAANEK